MGRCMALNHLRKTKKVTIIHRKLTFNYFFPQGLRMRCLVAGCQQLFRTGENRAYYNLSQAFIMDLFQVNTQTNF